MRRLWHRARRAAYFRPRRTAFLAYIITVLLAIGATALLTNIDAGPPNALWVPDNTKKLSDDKTVYSLPIYSKTIDTKFGSAVYYESDGGQDKYYILRSGPKLKASDCPNITNIEPNLPSDCKKIGTFKNQPVYTMERRLSSFTAEYFIDVNGSFIHIVAGGGSFDNLDVANRLRPIQLSELQNYTSKNKTQVEQILAKRKAAEEARVRNENLAYTRLTFTPYLPTAVPANWNNSNNDPKKIYIDGVDADHPALITTDYWLPENENFIINWHVGKLSEFSLTTQCGPTPGFGMEALPCRKVPGKPYYEATGYGELNDFWRVLYYPIGDTLIITTIIVQSKDAKRPAWPTELARMQDSVTLSAQPVELSALKGSTYRGTFY